MNSRSQTLSAVVVTSNHASAIERTLESLRWADELIVIDSGSTDGTLAIARRFTENIYFHPSENPAVHRQYGFALATGDWVLSLLPGEWVEETLRHEIDGVLLAVPEDVSGFKIPVKTYLMGQWLRYGGNYPRRQLRLFRKGHAPTQAESGQTAALVGAIGYEPFQSPDDIALLINRYSTEGAYRLVEAGDHSDWRVSLLNIMARSAWVFVYRYIGRLGFSDGFGGLVMALTQGTGTFLKYTKLRALFKTGAV